MSTVAPLPPPAEFLRASESLGISFDAGDIEKLGRFLAMLLDANTRFNLTAITNPDEAWRRHIFDSITLVPYVISLDAKAVMDVGSGGGLPGIPLAIVLPNVQFTLLEATGKKARFLQDVVNDLGLRNVRVINDRAETVAADHKGGHREHYDLVMARAVGRLPVLLELTVPFAKVGGHVLAMKGEKAAEEIAEAKQALYLLHAQVTDTIHTPTGALVIIEKTRKTPRTYPRSPGEPKRSPLH